MKPGDTHGDKSEWTSQKNVLANKGQGEKHVPGHVRVDMKAEGDRFPLLDADEFGWQV